MSDSRNEIIDAGGQPSPRNGAAGPMHWRRRTLSLIAVLLAIRGVFAAIAPLDLIADEAYYWDWSRHLDWGYFSKPPLVAWIIRIATEVGGSTAASVRTPAVLLGTLGIWWIYLLAERMFGARTGFWAAALSALTPGNTALAFLMTIDAPFLFCWGLALYGLWRMLERRPGRTGWVAMTGFAVGLGLLSKESMIAFLMAAWLFVIVSREDRRELSRPGWWVMNALALVCLSPVVVWNSRHDWITLQHSSTHFETQATDLGHRLLRSAEFVGGQLGLISPVTFVVFCAVAGVALLRWRSMTRAGLFLLCFSALPLAGVLALSLTRRVMPNWPAPFYAAGLVVAAAWLCGRSDFGEMPQRLQWLFPSRDRVLRRSVWCGAVCVALTCVTPWAVHWLGLAGSKLDATARLRGWSDFARQVEERQSETPNPQATFVFVATGRQETSELAFYLPGQPQVPLWNPVDQTLSQYDLWPLPTNKGGWDALIVTDPQRGLDPALARQFREIGAVPINIEVPLGNGRNRHFILWTGRDFLAADRPEPDAAASTVAHDPDSTSTTR